MHVRQFIYCKQTDIIIISTRPPLETITRQNVPTSFAAVTNLRSNTINVAKKRYCTRLAFFCCFGYILLRCRTLFHFDKAFKDLLRLVLVCRARLKHHILPRAQQHLELGCTPKSLRTPTDLLIHH